MPKRGYSQSTLRAYSLRTSGGFLLEGSMVLFWEDKRFLQEENVHWGEKDVNGREKKKLEECTILAET